LIIDNRFKPLILTSEEYPRVFALGY